MTTLPFAEEIRVARAASEAAHRARAELNQVEVTLRQIEVRNGVLRRLSQPIDPTQEQRRRELLVVQAALTPEAEKVPQVVAILQALLAEQHVKLHEPGHEQTVIAIKAIGRERQEVWDELEPVWQRVKVVEPVVKLIEEHIAKLEAATVDSATAAKRTAIFLDGIERALSAIGFEIQIPETAQGLRPLHTILVEERDALQRRTADARARHDELSAQILAITG